MKRLRVLMLAGIVVTSSFAGCNGCASWKDVRQKAAVVPAQPAVNSFALTERDVRCIDPAACGDPDVRMVLDLAKDFAGPVDWENEPDVWRENHDIEKNLPKDCADYDKILRLSRTRQKLFYILRKLSHDDPRWKDPEWLKNRTYWNLLFSRDAGRLHALFVSKRDTVVKAVALARISAADWGLFARELLRYRQMVVSTPGWESKFRDLATSGKNLVLGDHFHNAGFPRNRNACYHTGYLFGGNYIIGYDQGLEGWLYSFWLRRHQEGTMVLVKEALEWASARLPSETETSAEVPTMRATDPSQGGFDDPAAGREMGPNEQGILCNIHGGAVMLRSKPKWGSPEVDSQRCGAVVDIIAESARRARPERERDRYSAISYEHFSAYWYKVRVAASGAVGWVYSGELFEWTGREPAENGIPDFGSASDMYSPSSEEEGHEVDDDIDLPFLYLQGAPYVVPLSTESLTDLQGSKALVPPDVRWFVLVKDSSVGAVDSSRGQVNQKGKGYLLSLELQLHYHDGGGTASFSGYWENGDDSVALK